MTEPTLPSLEAWIANLDPAYVECRSLGHMWRPQTATWSKRDRYFIVTMLCPRCTTERITHLTKTGGRLSNTYQYAEGYATKGHGSLRMQDRDTLRLNMTLRVVDSG